MTQESEPNDTFATADALTLGTAITGQLAASDDLDVYKFTVTAAGALSLTLDVPTNSSYSDYFALGLYDKDGVKLNLYTTGADKTYQTSVAAAGSYYLAVSSSTYYSGGSYNLTATHTAGSTAGFESEANDTFATADALTLGTAITGQLAASDDLDVYKFTVTAAGALSLTLDVPTNSSYSDYFALGLYDKDGVKLNLYTTGADKTYQTSVAAAGSYYLAVSSSTYYSGGSYNLTATHTAGSTAGFESEANDTFATADALTLGTAITGQLAASDDLDVYKFTVTAAGALSLTLDVPTNSSYSDYFALGLYDKDGVKLNLYTTGVDKTYQTSVAAAGSYYLAVSSSTYYSGGSYNLTATHTAGSTAGFESEANDTFATADALTLGTAITGQLAASDDLDVYKFTVTAAGALSLTLDVPTNSSYSDYFALGLYDKDGVKLNLYTTGADKTYQTSVAAAGSYYLAVSSSTYYSGGSYNLTATHTAGSTAGFESEANDTFATADALTLGTAITGQLAASDDLDVYKFTVTAAGALSLTLDVPTNSSYSDYFALGLYDKDGVKLNLYTTGADKTYQTSVAAAGSYYLAVSSSTYYSGGSYNLTATHTAGSTAGFESEANDTFATADALTLGTAITGQLAASDDLDVYKFTVTAAGALSLTLDVPTNSSYSDYFALGLYDKDGVKLNLYTTGADKTYQTSVAAAGSYYLAVSSSTYYSGGSYNLTATHTAGSTAGFESEANDTFATADALTLGTAITGQLSSSRDVDNFSLNASGAGVFTLRFDAPTESTYSDYFTIRLVDDKGSTLSQLNTGRDQTFQAAVGHAGIYYVEVNSGDYLYDDGNYGLSATFSSGVNGLELEPNDQEANAINSGVQIRGQLSTSDDLDWFFLTTNEAGELQIAFDAPTSSSYSNYFQVWVFDNDGNLLASRPTGQDMTFTVGAPTSDNYYVAVTTAQNSLYDSGQYGLKVTSFTSIVNRESESNDTIATADSLILGSSILGQLASAEDVDRFSVALNSAGNLTINFDGPTNSTWSNYFRIDVFGPSGILLASRNTGVDTAFDVKALSGGNYTVSVSVANSWAYNPGEYRVRASAVFEDPPLAGAITGTPAGDRLVGTDQDDMIYGLGGNDQIDGGAGNDTAVFRVANSSLSVNTIGGLTGIRGGYSAGEYANTISRLWNVEKIKTLTEETLLSTAVVKPIFGTQQADKIIGTSGNDLIDGLGGSDFIDGQGGGDTLALFGAKDKFAVSTVAGITRIEGVDSSEEYAGHVMRTVGVEILGFTRNETRPLVVDETAKIFGSSSSDRLNGTGIDEIFDGLGGADTVDGGAGIDTLVFFGRYQDFTVALPSANKAELMVLGKSSAGKEYAGFSVRASNIEKVAFTDVQIDVKNPPSIVISPASTLLTEGSSGVAISISLSVQPTNSVDVVLSGESQLAASTSKLIFDSTNWDLPQAVTISAVDDILVEKQHSAPLSITANSADPLYAAIAPKAVTFTVSDNDVASVGGVSGRFWSDSDKDGFFDADEQPLAGWTVFDDLNSNGQLDAGEGNITTDLSGRYQLDDLSSGTHTIAAKIETGWSPTYPSLVNSSASIIVNASGSVEVSTGEVSSSALTASAASGLYANLGTATNIAAFHSDPRFSSINGQGSAVVVIDTGIDRDHPAFGVDADQNGVADRIVYGWDYVGANDPDASDVKGHGTHVAGIIGSSDATYPGIAPNVNIIALRVLGDDGKGTSGDIKEALDWVVTNAKRYNVVAVNMSLGNSSFDQVPTSGYASSQLKALANAGVVVVSASGNNYINNPKQGVSYPSSDPYSLSVGAVWASSEASGGWGSVQSGSTDTIAVFSQRDDSESDIFAPGMAIYSVRNGGGYIVDQGTSMAAPEISGMVALAQQLALRELGRRLSFDEIRSLLKSSGDPIVDGDNENDGSIPNTGLTFYRADMLALAEAILQLKPPVSHTVTINNGSIVEAKDFGFYANAVVQGLSADDFIVGAGTGEIIRGGSGSDQIDGGEGDDQIFGEAGDDRLTGGTGNDTIDGGEGSDTAVFNGLRSGYNISWSATTSTFSVTSTSEGSDLLSGIETLTFLDGSYSATSLQNTNTPSAPTLTAISPLSGATEDTAFIITYATLAAAADEADAQGDPISFRVESITSGTLTKNGSTVVAGNTRLSAGEELVWMPAVNVNGNLTAFTVRAVDVSLASDKEIKVYINVNAVNDVPLATSATVSTEEDTAKIGALAGTDAEGSTLTFAKATDPSHGTVTINATTGAYTYTPVANYSGADSFTYKVNDGTVDSASARVSITVASVNDNPTGKVLISGIAEVGHTLAALDTLNDADGRGSITYQWLANGNPLPSQTSNTLDLSADLLGKSISLKATYTDGSGNFESVLSATSTPVKLQPKGTGVFVDVKLSQHTVDASYKSTSSSDPAFLLSSILDSMVRVWAGTEYYYKSSVSYENSGTQVISHFSDGSTKTRDYIKQVPGATSGYADVSQYVFNKPLSSSSGIIPAIQYTFNGDMRYQYNELTGALGAIDGTVDSLRLKIFDNTGTFGGDSITSLTGTLGFDLKTSGNLNGSIETISISTSEVTQTIEGVFTASGNINNIASGLESSTLSGQLKGLTQVYPDGSYFVAKGESDAIPIAIGAKEDFSSVFLRQDILPGDDTFNIEVPATLYELMEFFTGAGNDTVTLKGGGDQLFLDAGTGNDVVLAADGDQIVRAGEGDDRITGGAGNDSLDGGAGTDTAVFSQNFSQYTFHAIALGWAISGPDGNDTVLNFEVGQFADQNISLSNFLPTGQVSVIGTFAQGYFLTANVDLNDLDGMPANTASAFSYQWRADGVQIQNASSSTLRLTQSEVGKAITVVVSYTDGHGNSENVISPASVPVNEVNHTPTLEQALADYRVTENRTLSVTVPAASFADVDDATLTYSAKLANGSALPSWMQFNATTRTFSISPGVDVVGSTAQTFAVTVTASDSAGLTASDSFDVLVRPLGSGYDIQANIAFWKADSGGQLPKLSGVAIAKGVESGTSTALAGVTLHSVEDTEGADEGFMTLTPQANSPSNAKSAVTLTDVLAALKVYLGKSLPDSYTSPLNYIAADFDANGTVNLTDVLSLLKYYLGKTTTSSPSWVFVDAADFSTDGKSLKGANSQAISKTDATPHGIDQTFDTGHESIQILGVLRGDVDGSWSATL